MVELPFQVILSLYLSVLHDKKCFVLSRKCAFLLSITVQCCEVWPVEICCCSLGQWRSGKLVTLEPYQCDIRAISSLASQPLLPTENSLICSGVTRVWYRTNNRSLKQFSMDVPQIFYKTKPSCPCQGYNFNLLF